ncbi:MAG: hypothetical protein IKQ15_08540, partial [Kiritimatiellae bacterium]|nr:hypothetical protein [Kiritimatiellia bacterium]
MQANAMGDADAIQPGLGETCVRTFPASSSGMTDTGGQGLPALPILAHGKSQGFHLTTPMIEKNFPMVGKNAPIFPMIGKIFRQFSNDWKKFSPQGDGRGNRK